MNQLATQHKILLILRALVLYVALALAQYVAFGRDAAISCNTPLCLCINETIVIIIIIVMRQVALANFVLALFA